MTSETELQMVERHVREGAAIVLRQKDLIAELADGGHATAAAETLLVSFEAIQSEHIAHLARITEHSSAFRLSRATGQEEQ